MNDKLKEELLTAVAVALAALFFATVLTLIVARYYKQIKTCCLRCCPVDEGDPVDSPRDTFEKNGNIPYNKMIEDVKRSSNVFPRSRLSPMFMTAQDNPFTIPGSFFAQAIQPEIKLDSLSDENQQIKGSSISGSPQSSPLLKRRGTLSTMSLPANFSPLSSKNITKSLQESPAESSEEDDNASTIGNRKQTISIEDLMFLNIRPELYDISRRKTVGKGTLGKISISLQYEDKSRRRLNLFIQKINKLQFARPDIIGIYGSIVLLPERETIFTTNQHDVTASPIFEEKFIFSSKPMNRDFESKTVLILVHYTDRGSKDVIYGEARMPLLSTEIYSQVPTDVTLNIKSASMQSEFGDLLIQMIYSDSGTLSVMVKMIKVPSSMSLENMSAIRVKCYMKKLNSRFGKKHSFACSLSDINQHMIDLNGECHFKMSKDQFMDCDLICAVFGKHKILGKKLSLGKSLIGCTGRDETGIVHWRTIFNSPGVAWSVWHPIYNS